METEAVAILVLMFLLWALHEFMSWEFNKDRQPTPLEMFNDWWGI